MPLPKPRKGEKQDAFVARCMSDGVMRKEFPDDKQRAAVCYAQWRGRKPGQAQAEAMPSTFLLTAPIELQASGGGVSGADTAAPGAEPRLPRFTMVAYTGAPMRVGLLQFPVVVDLAGLRIPDPHRPIRLGHDPNMLLGHTERIEVVNHQLLAEGVLSFAGGPEVERVVRAARNGFRWRASISAQVDQVEFVRPKHNVVVNGREVSGPVNVVRRATLGEISFVDVGADGGTSASLAAAAASVRVKEDKAMDDEQVKEQDVVAADAEVSATSVEALRAAAVAEQERIMAVRRVCGTDHPEIAATAIREGWDATRTELEVLRATRPKVTQGRGNEAVLTQEVLEAACVLSGGLPAPEKHYPEQTLEVAHKRFRSGLGLQELILEAAWANGYQGRSFRDTRGAMRAAFGHDVQAGFSTVDISGILSNVANKFLLEGFFSVERTWRNICSVRNVSDFKTVTSYRLIGRDQYEQVAPGGELKHGTLGEEKYENRADTYGLILTIDRRDVINDDLGAITGVPKKLGRGSGLAVNDRFWAIFLANSSFFTAQRGNYLSGADTVLGVDGLTKAEVAFLSQVDSDGKPIGVMPAIVLVPTALSAMGTQLYKSLEIRDTTASTKFPVANPHAGKFRVEVSRYLSNANYAGNSAKAWYLLADPSDLPVIEVAFLNGQEAPTIETAEADFNVLGIQMRGYHDFGVALQDWRGGVKVKGEV